MKRTAWLAFAALAASVSGLGVLVVKMGRQPDGTYIVSTGQHVLPGTLAFEMRMSDIALHPNGKVVAAVGRNRVFLIEDGRTVDGGDVALGANAGFHGVAWTPDGKRLFASTDKGHVQEFLYEDGRLTAGTKIDLVAPDRKINPQPGGMSISPDGKRLYVACAYLNAAVEVDLATNQRVRELPTQNIPFLSRITEDGSTLLTTNWGGEVPGDSDDKAPSQDQWVKVDKRGAAIGGTLTVTDLKTGSARQIEVGLHPTDIAVQGNLAYVANSMSDSVSLVDWKAGKVLRTIDIRYGKNRLVGSMPNALAVKGDTLYSGNGGDNAVCEIDLKSGKVRGFRPAGYYPTGLQVAGNKIYAVNTKGNGSVRNTNLGKPGGTHDIQGTVSIIDLGEPLKATTAKVAELNSWDDPMSVQKPKLKVYNGAIKHVIYVIKENRTYDEIFGDMGIGNGDPKLASLGKTVMPNHQKIAREFTLFDNAYTSGTNSADGHNWCVQAMANEYLEHFYVGYSRSYPDDGQDAMALNSTDRIWDAAVKKGLSVRVYGEWATADNAKYEPRPPKDWFEAWEDRESGRNMFKYKARSSVANLNKYLCPDYFYWPLIMSDQHRMDVFEREFKAFEKSGQLPNLIVISLPSDHGEGTNPAYPTPRAMQANNDLALGRLVELVTHSKFWKDTCMFVTEDDSQSGPDHIDGHRTLQLVLSPYTKRKEVSSEFCTQLSIHKSIGTMLGFGPLCKFDAIARPITSCFTDTPDLTPYTKTPNIVPLDEANPGRKKPMTAEERYWYEKTMSLDWSGLDRADPYWLNRINWWSIYRGSRPYPSRPGDRPGMEADEDED
ncbi:MAG: bifunctional YncE family protein/alkaline phosphatase family protein [Fimbriimonadales bacterium]